MRKTFKDEFFKKHNVKLGYMSAFVKAASFALKDQPVVNAGMDAVVKYLFSTSFFIQSLVCILLIASDCAYGC